MTSFHVEGEIPDVIEIARLEPNTLPPDWHETVRPGFSVALFVPSAAIRGEWNVLLNPAHRDFSSIRFRAPAPFEFDVRMFR